MEYPEKYLEICEKANQCRRLWNIPENSPIDIFTVVLDKIENVTICLMDLEENLSGSSCKKKGQNIIFINSKHPLGRQRFTLAHELYHLEYQEEFTNCDINSDTEIEEEADQFASCLLMSNGALFNYEMENNIKEWTLDDVIQTEQYFQISHKAMLRRLKTLNKISEDTAEEYLPDIKFNASIRGYALNLYEPYSNKKNLVLGNYIQMTNKAYELNKISESKRDELLLEAFCDDIVYNTQMDDLIE